MVAKEFSVANRKKVAKYNEKLSGNTGLDFNSR
jgi:hypothetical protein